MGGDQKTVIWSVRRRGPLATRLDLRNKAVDARPFKKDYVSNEELDIDGVMHGYKHGLIHKDRIPPGVMSDLKGAYPEYFGEQPGHVRDDPLECVHHVDPAGKDLYEELRRSKEGLAPNPKDAGALARVGYWDLRLEHYVAAILSYERVLTADPGNGAALTNKGVSLARIGHHKEAVRCYDTVLGADPGNPIALRNRAASLAALGMYEESAGAYRSALGAVPGHGRMLCCLGSLLARLGRHGEALDAYSRIAGGVEDVVVHANRAASYAAIGDYAGAEGSYAMALASDPDDKAALAGTAALRAARGRYDEALGIYDMVCQTGPSHFAALAGRAAVLAILGRHEEALESYGAALRRSPGQRQALAGMAASLAEAGRREEALSAYDKALGPAPRRLLTYGRHEGAMMRPEAGISRFAGRSDIMAGRGATLSDGAGPTESVEAGAMAVGSRVHAIIMYEV